MKIKYCVPLLALTIGAVACGKKDKAQDASAREVVVYDVNNMDTTFVAGDDFYQYANGGWIKSHPLKDEYASYRSFDDLGERNKEQIKELIIDLGTHPQKEGSNAAKIGMLYAVAMDSAKLNAEGIKPIEAQLQKINSISDRASLINMLAELSIYANTPFIGLTVMADQKDSDNNMVRLYPSGLGLGERDYYLKNDEASKKIRESYEAMIVKQFKNIGYDQAKAENAAKVVMNIETALAKSFPTKESRRDPELNYKKIKKSDLNKEVGKFEWDLFFSDLGAKDFEYLNVGQTSGLKEAIRLINATPSKDMKDYLSWKLVSAAVPYLTDDIYATYFDFYGKTMQGKKAMQPRWKRAISNVENALGEAVGQMYVEKYFPADAKKRMQELVKNLQLSLSERIDNLTWMSADTKKEAQKKLSTFHVKIGYPDKWEDYSKLDIKDDSYWMNMVRASYFDYAKTLDKIGKPVDKDEWLMYPQMVNAYYMPTTNEICFPAGILQPPFFYLDGDDAVNYGGIGVVIGHEMSHGFDDQGSKYNFEGNLKEWWTEEDRKKFNDRADVLVKHFDEIEVLPGLKANGKFTLGENIGDFGGLQIAFNAFGKTQEAKENILIDGFTPNQRFFLSYANLWAGTMRDEEKRRLTEIDVHSLGEWRVNGTLPHVDAWYEAFDIKEGNKLYLPKEKRADIW